jgi:hypothetical protein
LASSRVHSGTVRSAEAALVINANATCAALRRIPAASVGGSPVSARCASTCSALPRASRSRGSCTPRTGWRAISAVWASSSAIASWQGRLEVGLTCPGARSQCGLRTPIQDAPSSRRTHPATSEQCRSARFRDQAEKPRPPRGIATHLKRIAICRRAALLDRATVDNSPGLGDCRCADHDFATEPGPATAAVRSGSRFVRCCPEWVGSVVAVECSATRGSRCAWCQPVGGPFCQRSKKCFGSSMDRSSCAVSGNSCATDALARS